MPRAGNKQPAVPAGGRWHGGKRANTVSELTELRAEVEALADETRALCETSPTQEIAWSRGGQLGAYHRVLDLIDKRQEEASQ